MLSFKANELQPTVSKIFIGVLLIFNINLSDISEYRHTQARL